MGHSHTYNVLVHAIKDDIDHIAGAMSKTDIAQIAHKFEHDGKAVYLLEAQTSAGKKMLNGETYLPYRNFTAVLVSCPVCDKHGCPVCNFSGITRNNHWLKWQDWQIENMRSNFAKDRA